MEYNMLIRKKYLKVQDRLGMRIGIIGGTRKIKTPRTTSDVLDILRDLYNIGLKAYVIPREFFSRIKNTTELYKTYYGDLLKIKDIANKYGIELSIQYTDLQDYPDEALKLFFIIASIMDCRLFIIRPTFYPMVPKDQALKLVVYKLNEIVSETNMQAKFGIETTGRLDEVGSLDEVIDIVKRTRNTEPVINWGNVNARGTGYLRSAEEIGKVLKTITQNVGHQYISRAFFIFSGAVYGPSGFTRSAPIKRSDMKLEHLIKQIMSYGIKGTLIFDDPDKEKFALEILDDLADMVR